MGTLLTDIFVTIKDRYPLAVRSLKSLLENTRRDHFRLTVMIDGAWKADPLDEYNGESKLGGMHELMVLLDRHADYVIQSRENEGLGPTINRAVAHIGSINEWYSHPTHGDPNLVAPLITMCQDDLIYTNGWLSTLAGRFFAYEKMKKIGFASGVECVEHKVREVLTPWGDMVTKDWIRASQMMGRREYWQSMMPIPRFDPETGQVRAKPNDGMGSGVDWWLIRNHENSVVKTGRTNLVMPGLVVHAGYAQSTWLQNGREMPESESDKEKAK